MKNLPVFTQDLLKGCKVFAIVGALSLCCACGGGGGETPTPEGDVSASPMSGEVEVKGDEVASESGEATTEEGKSGDATTEDTAGAEGGEVAVASGEAASDFSEKPAEPEAKKTPERKVMSVGKVRDPFDKYYGAPAIGTSLSGGVKPSADRGKVGLNSAVRKRLAQKAKKNKEPAKTIVKVSKPDVKVTGILRSGSTYRAILQGPEKAIMVTPGEQIGGYRVAGVSPKDVTLVYKNKYKFVIPLEKEVFGSSGSSAAPSASNNLNAGSDAASAVSAPVIEITK